MKDNEILAQNQSYLRSINQKSVLKHLRREKMCCADLAKRLNLSNTAIGKIVDDLVQRGIVLKGSYLNQRNNVLQINDEAGVVMSINLAGQDISVCLISLSSQIIEKAYYHNGSKKITDEDLDCVIKLMHDVLQRSSYGRPLLALSVGTPGKIDRATGNFLLAPHFVSYKTLNLGNLFTEKFNCPVIIQNDIKLAIDGERRYGAMLSGIRNALLIYIDIGVGASLMLNDKVYDGTNGFAGEIGYYTIDTCADEFNFCNPRFSNNLNALSIHGLTSTLRLAMQEGEETILNSITTPEELCLENMIYAYNNNDKLVKTIINNSAMVWARNIRNMIEFLDLGAVLISGDIQKFGSEFLNIITDYIHDNAIFTTTKIGYSEFSDGSTILGGMNLAIKKAVDVLLSKNN